MLDNFGSVRSLPTNKVEVVHIVDTGDSPQLLASQLLVADNPK